MLELTSPPRSHRANQFPVRSHSWSGGGGRNPGETSYDAIPAGVRTLADNYGRESIPNNAYQFNSVDEFALKTTNDGNAAVSTGAVQTGAIHKRWFGAADQPLLTDGVRVPNAAIIEVGAGKITGEIPEGNIPNNLSGSKLKNKSVNPDKLSRALKAGEFEMPKNLPNKEDLNTLEANMKRWASAKFVEQGKKKK
jgi:hypothetical protein